MRCLFIFILLSIGVLMPVHAASTGDEAIAEAVRLANAGDLGKAVDVLDAFLDEHPDDVAARVRLARYQSWRGFVWAARTEANRVLERDARNREALSVLADTASWAGDTATALAVYRRMLAEKEDFDVRLGYTYALLASGDYGQAKYSRWWLFAAKKNRSQTVAEVGRALLRQAERNVEAETNYTHAVDRNERREQSIGLHWPLRRSSLSLRWREVEAQDPSRRQALTMLEGEGAWRLDDRWKLSSRLTVAEGENAQRGGAQLGLVGRAGHWNGQLVVEHGPRRDTAIVLQNKINRTSWLGKAGYVVNDRIRFDATLRREDYSDNNAMTGFDTDARFALKPSQPRVAIGLKREQRAFERQSGGGYFDPDLSRTDKFLLEYQRFADKLDTSLELFYGSQLIERAGNVAGNPVAGGSANVAYRFGDRREFGLSAEGGDFALGREGAYRYYTVSGRVTANF